MRKAAAAVCRRRTEGVQIPAAHRLCARVQRRIKHKAARGNAAVRTDVQIPLVRGSVGQPREKCRIVAERRVRQRMRRAQRCRIQVAHARNLDRVYTYRRLHSRVTSS